MGFGVWVDSSFGVVLIRGFWGMGRGWGWGFVWGREEVLGI